MKRMEAILAELPAGEEKAALQAALEERTGPARTWALLLYLGLRVARERYGGVAKALTQAVFHLPLELVALHLGVDRTTVWRHLGLLQALGLVRARDHYGTLKGRTVVTGKVWFVLLKPGGRIKAYAEDLSFKWRDLEEDKRSGRTAYRFLKAKVRPTLEVLEAWALGRRMLPPQLEAPLEERPPQLYDIFALPDLEPQARPTVIDRLSEWLSVKLKDPYSRRFYAGLLWEVVEGKLEARVLVTQVERVLVAIQEGYARKPGALLNVYLGRKSA